MEAPREGEDPQEDPREDRFREPGVHGLAWAVLNKTLHFFVLIFTLLGLIRFKIEPLSNMKLVRGLSYVLVAQSWYLTLKFAIIAVLMFAFNEIFESESRASLTYLACPRFNELRFFDPSGSVGAPANSSIGIAGKSFHLSRLTLAYELLARGDYWTVGELVHATQRGLCPVLSSINLLLAHTLDLVGGPYRLLGDRATLMFGFYSVSTFLMLAIFPFELLFRNIKFNYIHFVLNEGCYLRDFHQKRRGYVKLVRDWYTNSRTLKSYPRLDTRQAARQRKLRSSNLHKSRIVPIALSPASLVPIQESSLYTEFSASSPSGVGKSVTLYRSRQPRMNAPVNSLRHSQAADHQPPGALTVKVADQSLADFRPYVRSESWFKISMILYASFIVLNGISLTIAIGAITVFFTEELTRIGATCTAELGRPIDLFALWSRLDLTNFIELRYTVLALSVAAAFYTSLYFGTILDLVVWLEEVSQQLEVCRWVVELSGSANPFDEAARRAIVERLRAYRNSEPDSVPDECVNKFGGLKSLPALVRFRMLRQSQRLKRREITALSLISHRRTLLQATYVNVRLVMGELNDSRRIVGIILLRTGLIVFAFSYMAGVTKSQFEAHHETLSFLLVAALVVLNLYLVGAAFVLTRLARMVPRVHSLISALLVDGTEPDTLEMWQQFCATLEDEDGMCYKVMWYNVTFFLVAELNESVFSAYTYNF